MFFVVPPQQYFCLRKLLDGKLEHAYHLKVLKGNHITWNQNKTISTQVSNSPICYINKTSKRLQKFSAEGTIETLLS